MVYLVADDFKSLIIQGFFGSICCIFDLRVDFFRSQVFLAPFKQGIYQRVLGLCLFLEKLCITHGHHAHNNEQDKYSTHDPVEHVWVPDVKG